jgi:transcriptional regulator with XRE-family HTH domain
MRPQRRTTVIVVGGALAIASVGYGLGTQAGDGNAIADNATEQDGGSQDRGGRPLLPFERGAPPGFSDLADRLGVDVNQLMRAMRDFHDQHDASRRAEFTNALADALGVSREKVESAFGGLHQRREDRFAARLADALDADVDDVKAALEKLEDEGPVQFPQFASKLADELGLDVSDVRAALIKSRPFDDLPHRRSALPLRQLSTALGVSRNDLRAAFRELRRSAVNGWEQRSKELAQFLADRFHLDVDKVSDALAATAPPLSSRHRPPGLPGGLPDHPAPL